MAKKSASGYWGVKHKRNHNGYLQPKKALKELKYEGETPSSLKTFVLERNIYALIYAQIGNQYKRTFAQISNENPRAQFYLSKRTLENAIFYGQPVQKQEFDKLVELDTKIKKLYYPQYFK